jgi:hypothetical protein
MTTKSYGAGCGCTVVPIQSLAVSSASNRGKVEPRAPIAASASVVGNVQGVP